MNEAPAATVGKRFHDGVHTKVDFVMLHRNHQINNQNVYFYIFFFFQFQILPGKVFSVCEIRHQEEFHGPLQEPQS